MGESPAAANAMAPMPQGEYVVVWFARPVLGADPDDGVEFTSDRHKVPARWVRQDPNESVFIDDLGSIVGPVADLGDSPHRVARRRVDARRQGSP